MRSLILRKASIVAAVSVLASMTTVIGVGAGTSSAYAAPSLTIVNTVPMVDPSTGQAAAAGVVGDTLTLSAVGLTAPVVAYFAGVANGLPTTLAGPNTVTVVVPVGAVSGPLSVMDSSPTQIVASTGFQIWATHSQPYVMANGHLNITVDDLKYILDQVKIGEAHAARTTTASSALKPTPNVAKSTITYPYDVTSATRCLTAADIQAAGTATFGATGLSNLYPFSTTAMWGVRQVDGQCNNITDVRAETVPNTIYSTPNGAGGTAAWGAADELFTRLTPATNTPTTPYVLNSTQKAYQNPANSVKDPTPRIISNLIADQSDKNPAAVAAAAQAFATLYGSSTPTQENSVNATTGAVSSVVQIPNVTSDYNVSAGYNSWFTLFGQFYDHGLDLIPKAGASVYIPLQQSDPLYVPSPTVPNLMVLTRGADAVTGESVNSTTPYIDQSQSYGSHASQNFFVREYSFAAGTGTPSTDGRLLDGTDQAYSGLPTDWANNITVGGSLTHATGGADISNNGLPTWKDMKAQARLLGFELSDYDVRSIPVVATDQYGKFVPGNDGMPMMLFGNGSQFVWASGTAAAPIATGTKTAATPAGGTTLPGLNGSNWVAVSTGHSFINDTMASAVPFSQSNAPLLPDADTILDSSSTMPVGYYDNENLDGHYVAGDGRVNENIGLSAIHGTFHSEHNTVVKDIATLLANDPVVTPGFKAEWSGDRLYQAARFVNEMEYQHLVYDEFIRRISPSLPVFIGYDPTIDPSITAEFASAVYRVGHSMLNESIARSNPGKFYDPTNNQDVSLLTGFTNPAQARLPRPAVIDSATQDGTTITYTMHSGETAPLVGEIVTISALADAAYNVTNAVVTSSGSGTFTVSMRYAGGSASSSSAIALGGAAQSTASTVASTNGALLANVAITDPSSNGFPYTTGAASAAIAQGMSSQRGNEIDEFVTDAVRTNLLGLPLDLASLNITRGRETGLPTLNQFRSQYPTSLPVYGSWLDYIAALRYPESGINFVAAYGTHPSITAPVAIADVTSASALASAGNVIITYTAASAVGVQVGDVVTVRGLTAYNVSNAVVDSVTSTTFTVSTAWSHSPSAVVSFATAAALRADKATAIAGVTGVASPSGASASATREPNVDERRAAATVLVNGTDQDSIDFMNSIGAWSSVETGINDVDLWMGGLAENPAKQPITPPMLGTTFQFVFEDQSLKLQDGDRFYYLGRVVGSNLGEEIPAQKFTDMVRRNTPSASGTLPTANATGIIGMVSPGFAITDCAFSVPTSLVPTSAACAPSTMSTNARTGSRTHTGLDNVTGFGDPSSSTPAKLTGGAGDDNIFGGPGNDIFISGTGGDLVDGAAGDDIILGGGGEDLIKGGAGNDAINAGESQIGDIADGGSGNDFIHCGSCTGLFASAIGEAGDDFIQGGKNADLLLEGGEGGDWVEGGAGLDFVNGDLGLLGGGLNPMLSGGNDNLNGGTGNDLVAGDGGDDVMAAGEGTDIFDGGTGFDWINYAGNKRLDNSSTKAGVYVDLSGVTPNPLNNPGDVIMNAEGIAGSPGKDVLVGSLAADVTIPIVSGAVGTTLLTIPGAVSTIVAGMQVSGTGIGYNATTVGPGTVAIVNGITTTTIDLTVENTGTVTGPVKFSTWQLRNPSSITGLAPYLSVTPGWLKYSTITPGATTWSGGNIIFGGAGNDRIALNGGENVASGSTALRTCIKVTHLGSPYITNADVACAGGRGYSSMTPLAVLMDAGTLSPGDLQSVRELASTSSPVTSLVATGTAVTYTAANTFAVGDSVSVSGLNLPAYNITNAIVTAATATTFTVASRAALIVATLMTSGVVVATDTLVLPGAEITYTIVPVSPLPAGVTTGVRITGPTGLVDTVYDMQMVSFAGAVAKPLIATGADLSTLVVASGTFSPAFASGTYAYQVGVLAGTTTTTITPTAANAGSTIVVNGVAVPTGTASGAITLTAGAASVVTIVVTAPDLKTTATYTLTIAQTGLTPRFSAPVSTADGFTVNVTNYSASYTFTEVTSPGVLVAGAVNGSTLPLTISGLTPGQSATVVVTTTRPGYTTGTASVTVVAGLAGLTPTLSVPVATATGYTVNVTNYNAAYAFTPSSTAGVVTPGTASGSTLPLTVTGLSRGQSATVTVAVTRTGYRDGTASATGTAGLLGLSPTFSTPVTTATGYTVNVTNYNAAYGFAPSVTLGVVAPGTASGTTLPLTVTGLTAGQSSTLTVGVTRAGYYDGTGSITVIAGLPGLTPTYSTPVATATGFTVNVTNYNAAYAFTPTTNLGVVTPGTASGSTLPLTVTGVTSGQSATVTVVATRAGYYDGTAAVTATALQPALTPALANAVSTASGFTSSITNYNASYTFTCTTSAGSCALGTVSGSTRPLTITGLTAGQSATITVTSTRAGYANGVTTLLGSATTGAALTPTFSTPVATATGFTVNVTNYNVAYTFVCSAPQGITCAVTWPASGTTAALTITGVAAGQPATITVGTSRTGFTAGSAQVTASALFAARVTTLSTPVRATTTLALSITNYDPTFTYTITASTGTVARGTVSGATLPITVTGLRSGRTTTLTIVTSKTGYPSSTVSVTA